MKQTLLLTLAAVAAFAQERTGIPMEQMAQPQITGYCRAPRTMLLGRPDNFANNGAEMAAVSPALQAYVTSKRALTKGFDDPTDNRWVVGSWAIPGCRVCRDVVITLNIRRKNDQGLTGNDGIAIGAAPFAGPNLLANLQPWLGNTLLTKAVTITIPMLQFNQFLINQPPGPVWLDFLLQDDTEVDSVQLSIVQ